MDALLLLLGILLVIVIIIGLPLFLIIYPYRKLRKTKFRKYAFIVPALVIGLMLYVVYEAVYPSDDFYKDDFESITKISFPQSGKILSKDADYPDQHGHYTSAAVVFLSSEDYNVLFTKVNNDKTFVTDTIIGESSGFGRVTAGIKNEDIKKIVKKGKMVIGFLDDNRRIILERRLSDSY